ncbi:MAG: rubrerythrin family protein [Chlorobi bacterium]|nr:rubrerythrin family protein [Chlorobiota bacterium]
MSDTAKQKELPPELRELIEKIQQDEITEYEIYSALARKEKDPEKAQLLQQIANDELKHYKYWKEWTGKDIKPATIKKLFYLSLAKIFPKSFVLKLMERGEELSQERYAYVANKLPDTAHIIEEERDHEMKLLDLIEEDILKYISSVVLGMNDALVEMIGALAGMSQAIKDSGVIAMAAFLTGFAASLSMAAAEYLSTREEAMTEGNTAKSPIKAATVTGITYILVVVILILPFLLLQNTLISLGIAVLSAIAIIAFFNFFVSIIRDRPFWRNFVEMVLILFGVTLISGGVGWIARRLFGIDI